MVDDTGDVAGSIAELQDLLLGTETMDVFLDEVAGLAARSVGPGISCGITLQPDGRPITVASSDVFASQVDEVQYGLDEGPCLHAMRTGEPVRIIDMAADGRWARYAPRALAHGVGSSLSMPLTGTGAIAGALNLYAPVAGAFDEAAYRNAERFTQIAAGAVAIAARLSDQAALTSQLRESLASRSVIDQAIGVLMAQQRCTASDAFAILRAASQNRNLKLRDIAARIITSVSGAPPQPPPFNNR